MTRLRSPNGAEWVVVDAGARSRCVTLDLDVLPDGTPATLRNEQTFSAAEIEAADGWQVIEG